MPRILIADDHSILRRRVREMLESEDGWEVCAEASNGREAVAMTAATRPDIVVLDLYMPEMDGFEAAGQIHRQFSQTAIVILSMHDTTELMDSLTVSGVRTFVSKVDLPQLIEAIGSIWREKCYGAGLPRA
jgi:DNA-binding NarL/FixJ family response regulator